VEFFNATKTNWYQQQTLPNKPFICGYCNTSVSSIKGYKLGFHSDGSGSQVGGVYLCPNCGGPSFLTVDNIWLPSPALGTNISHLPPELEQLHEESRRCTSQNCYTAAVLLCRKMLMNIAVQQGAKENLKFIEYVTYLADQGYIPPNGKHWVDHIRKKGNEATHEIALMKESDAKDLLTFVEMLLRIIFEFPKMIPIQAP